MLDLYSYAQHNYHLLKPKQSMCIYDLLSVDKKQATEEDLRGLLRHLKYEREFGNPEGEVTGKIYEYFSISSIDLL